ncbi:MAG: type II toxin-antitoxin system VapC family toxin [Myxococcaceae bacterium]
MLVDTSAWIEFLRGTESPSDRVLTALLEEGGPVAVTGVVVQEVLQGCRDERQAGEVRNLLLGCSAVEPIFPETFEHAAMLYRRCRKAGHTVRGAADCLVAAVALEHGLSVLAHDRDFDSLRRHCGLSLYHSAAPRSRR